MRRLIAGAALALALTACGGEDQAAAPAPSTAPPAPATTAPAPSPSSTVVQDVKASLDLANMKLGCLLVRQAIDFAGDTSLGKQERLLGAQLQADKASVQFEDLDPDADPKVRVDATDLNFVLKLVAFDYQDPQSGLDLILNRPGTDSLKTKYDAICPKYQATS